MPGIAVEIITKSNHFYNTIGIVKKIKLRKIIAGTQEKTMNTPGNLFNFSSESFRTFSKK